MSLFALVSYSVLLICYSAIRLLSRNVEQNSVSVSVSAIKHPMPDRVKPSFVIFDIRAL